jgi:hypothetical protein
MRLQTGVSTYLVLIFHLLYLPCVASSVEAEPTEPHLYASNLKSQLKSHHIRSVNLV